MRGEVVQFGESYGFIRPEDGSRDVFVHFSAIVSNDKHRRLMKAQKVEYKFDVNEKGPYATEVRVISEKRNF